MKVFKLRLENSLPRMLWKTSKQGKLVRNWFPCNPVTRSVNITEDLLQKGHYPRPIAVVLQSFSCVWHFGTPRTAAHQASLSFTIFWSLHKLMLTESVMPSNHLILSRPFFLLPLIFPSIRVFSNELALLIRWPKYWSFSISPFNKYSGLISFRIDWFDLPAVQGTLKSLLQHHNSKALILQCSAFFMVQLSHPYITTGKTTALTIWTFVSNWCLCFLIHCLGLSNLDKPDLHKPKQGTNLYLHKPRQT